VLAFREVDYDRTHSIGYLTSLLEHHGIGLPEEREQIEELTPWAVAARYEDRFEGRRFESCPYAANRRPSLGAVAVVGAKDGQEFGRDRRRKVQSLLVTGCPRAAALARPVRRGR
jgi:hypothetical protein